METVTLTTGVLMPARLVGSTMFALTALIREDAISFYELVMKARDAEHQWFGQSARPAHDIGLVNAAGEIEPSVRQIIAAAVTGDGLDMRLVSPVR